MNKIKSYADLVKHLRAHPVHTCWYGPRLSDIEEIGNLIHIDGVVACYGSRHVNGHSSLVGGAPGIREKCSIDNLAGVFARNGKFASFVRENKIVSILPYDTNAELEEFCMEHGILLLSAPDRLKDALRDKTKIDGISRSVGLPTIPGVSGVIDDFEFEPLARKLELPLFLQFAEGAGGSGNYIVSTKSEFEYVKIKQKGKRLNIKKYFVGKTYTIDICVTASAVMCGTLEEEIIGAEPLCSNPTEYVASSWFENGHSYEVRKNISKIGVALGEYVRSRGVLGCFHPDFLIGPDGEIVITELNMRFGGSCGAYTRIQVAERQIPILAIQALAFTRPELVFDAEMINEQNLRPLNYGLLVLKNNFGRQVTISGKYVPGLYTFTGGRIEFQRKIQFPDFSDTSSIVLGGLPESGRDTIVENGALICEVMTRFPISNSCSKLNHEGRRIVEMLFSQLIV